MFIPVRNQNQSDRFPLVTIGLIGSNIIIFLGCIPLMIDPKLAYQFNQIYTTWGLVPAEIMHGASQHSFATSLFLHGGVLHLVSNMLFLWIFGGNLEESLGSFGFLLVYLAAGFAGAAAHVLSDPGSTLPLVGASGAIAGVLGASLLLHPLSRIDIVNPLLMILPQITAPAWFLLLVWFGFQVVSGDLTGAGSNDGVAYWAHIGGFVGGVVLAMPHLLMRQILRRAPPPSGWQPPPEIDIRALRKSRSGDDLSD